MQANPYTYKWANIYEEGRKNKIKKYTLNRKNMIKSKNKKYKIENVEN